MRKSKQYYNSKEYKEYLILSSRFRITQAEFSDYYKKIRLSRKKSARLKKSGTAIYYPKYSLSVSGIKSRKDFEKRVEKVDKFLLPSYIKNKNKVQRENLYETLRNYYGEAAEVIITSLSDMDDRAYIKFFKDNPDIKFIEYYQGDSSNYLELINETIESFKGRLGIEVDENE